MAEWVNTYDIHHWEIFRSSFRKLAWVWFEPTTVLWIPFKRCNRLSYQAMGSSHSQSQLWRATRISSLCSVLTFHFSLCSRQSPHLLEAKSRTGNHVAAEEIDTYGIHHCSIFRSSYRKLAWVGIVPTSTEFHSDALTIWAMRPWVQLALRANSFFGICHGYHLNLKFIHISSEANQ